MKRDDESDSYKHQSRNSLYPTDDENPLLFRSHSSSLNSSSYLSLHSRKASLAKSSNTLFEKYAKLYFMIIPGYVQLKPQSLFSIHRYGSIIEDYEEPDFARIKRKYCSSHRRPSIKFLNERQYEKSTASLGSIKVSSLVSEDSFAEAHEEKILALPALSRKPSISFNETVSVIKAERRNSSPCKNIQLKVLTNIINN